jgi:hypothetical protein
LLNQKNLTDLAGFSLAVFLEIKRSATVEFLQAGGKPTQWIPADGRRMRGDKNGMGSGRRCRKSGLPN